MRSAVWPLLLCLAAPLPAAAQGDVQRGAAIAASRSVGLVQVAASRRGQPLLDEQQIDDVVAYLASLK